MSPRRLDLFLEQFAQTPALDVEDQAAACRTAAALRRFDRPMPRVLMMTSLESDPVAGAAEDILQAVLESRGALRNVERLGEDLLHRIKQPGHHNPPGTEGHGPVVDDVSAATLAEALWLLARARREYTAEEAAAQAAVFDAVADLLAGRATIADLVTGWAPSWRWPDFAPWGVRDAASETDR